MTDTSMRLQINDSEYYDFCNMTGTSVYQGELYGEGYDIIIKELRKYTANLNDFLAYYMAFVNCLQNREKGISQKLLLDILDRSFVASKLQYAVL